MAGGYTLTVRLEGTTERSEFSDRETALDTLEARCRVLSASGRRRAVSGFVREFQPSELVVARCEIAGRGCHGGIDMRGDGSVQVYTGRWRRRLVEPRASEAPYDALRRALA